MMQLDKQGVDVRALISGRAATTIDNFDAVVVATGARWGDLTSSARTPIGCAQ